MLQLDKGAANGHHTSAVHSSAVCEESCSLAHQTGMQASLLVRLCLLSRPLSCCQSESMSASAQLQMLQLSP